MARNSQRVERSKIIDNAVADSFLFIFFHKSAKQSIPNYKHTAIICIKILGVSRMVYAVVGGRAKNKFYPPRKFTDRLCVYKKLIKQIDGADKDNSEGVHTQEHKGRIDKHHAWKCIKPRLA